MVLNRASRSLLFVISALWLLDGRAHSTPSPAIRPPRVTASVQLPKPPSKNIPKSIGPFTTGADAPTIRVDGPTRKKLDDLARSYAKVARDNYPLIVRMLHEKDPVVKPVHIVVTYGYGGVAATSGAGFGSKAEGAKIEVSAKYALAHPDDLGMIVHEMVHVVQRYPTYDPVWLVEGIADYVRWFGYEPETKRPHPNPARATARDSYRTTGAFLYWASNKYDPELVPKLNAAFRSNTYRESLFKDYTGKTLDELNTEWLASLGSNG